MTASVVERLARRFENLSSRRGFLVRAAVAGSAVAANPVGYVLKSNTAYAAVCQCRGQPCSCGTKCCDGYTEFCCTLTGENNCPPGSVLGGWWKADTSPYCNGASRYYMDCNTIPGVGSCSCKCAGGDCNHRVTCCVNFRYGQCHQEYPVLGPIVCRVVTCTPPWQLDPACTTAVAVDEATAYHDAQCLHARPPFGKLDAAELQSDGLHVRGWAIDPDTADPINVHVYVGATLFDIGLANRERPDLGAAFPGYGSNHGFDALVAAFGEGTAQVCAYGINVGTPTTNSSLGCRQVTFTAPIGNLDAVGFAPGGIRVIGWAIDPDTPDPIDVHIYINGVGSNIGVADRDRPDVAAAYPGYGANHGFDKVVPWSSAGPASVCAYGINVKLPAGNHQLGCRTINAGSPIGNVDLVATVPGGIRVVGWALDPETDDPIAVHVYVNEAGFNIGSANRSRPDVANAYPGYGSAHGYDKVVPWTRPGIANVCVYGINVGTSAGNPQLGCRAIAVGSPVGNLDQVSAGPGGIRVVGWALDPDARDPIEVHVYVNGSGTNIGQADQSRPDVAAAYAGYGESHGFDAVVPWTTAGTATVCAYAINAGSPTSNIQIGCGSVTV